MSQFSSKNPDAYSIISFKAEKEEAMKFDEKVGDRRKSEVLREMLKMFNRGEIKVRINFTIGG